MRVDGVEAPQASGAILALARRHEDRQVTPGHADYVCAANVHMAMQAHDDAAFCAVVNGAALVVPDGQPMVWALRLLGLPQRARVRMAPDLLLDLFAACDARTLKLGLYGGTSETLRVFVGHLTDRFPRLDIAYAWSPPFRPLTSDEDDNVLREVNDAGVQVLLVGIGCPKQERWMAAHADRLDCVMIGVGAAFDMLAGKTGDAPAWMRSRGLEWVYRLGQEPTRLWRRYLIQNPRFVAHFAAQVVRERLSRPGSNGSAG
jgi:N-acetylglucosaminyldiphosphoundecaprenol N-acetyl-beta-D-mannosaminyltransferase